MSRGLGCRMLWIEVSWYPSSSPRTMPFPHDKRLKKASYHAKAFKTCQRPSKPFTDTVTIIRQSSPLRPLFSRCVNGICPRSSDRMAIGWLSDDPRIALGWPLG